MREAKKLDWSRIKSIFIVAFLILNLYLIVEFYKTYHSSQYDYMSETSIENKLKTDEIEYEDLPKNIKSDKYMSAEPKKFTKEELEKVMDTILRGQDIKIYDETTIVSNFQEPFKLKEKTDLAELRSIVKNNVLYSEEYELWELDEDKNVITFYQVFDNKMLYKNPNGELIFELNDENEIIRYKQTLLENFEELSEEDNIFQPLKAIETLYNKGHLEFGSKITKVELGYYTYTLVHLTSSQVLTPVWRFVIDEKDSLFVNAIDGQIENLDKKIVE